MGMMSKERELLKRWLAGEANQIPTHVPLLIETQNLLAQPEALAPEREFIRLWYENIELWKVHAEEPEQNKPAVIMPNGVCVSNVYDAYEEGRKSVMSEQEPVAWMNDSCGCFLSDGNKYSENWTALYTAQPKQPEENIKYKDAVPNSIISRYEAGKRAMQKREQKSPEAELEQALKDTVDEERIRQIMINCFFHKVEN